MSTTEDAFLSALSEFFADACIIPRTGITTKEGRIELSFHRDRRVAAHRLPYKLFVGDIPRTMSVIQTCGNICCINPKHLRLGTFVDRTRKNALEQNQVFGTTHPLAKLNPDSVREIRASSLSIADLAEKYHVSRKCIDQVLNLKTWKHVTAKKESGNV